MKKRKLNKKKIMLFIIILIIFITLPTFGRYIYNSIRDLYLKAMNFSFSSNLLTTMGKTYKYSNWSGVEDYEIDLQLYSYENELSLFEYEGEGLKYNISCEVEDSTKVTAHIDTNLGEATGSGVIPNATNIKDVKIYLTPVGTLEAGQNIKVKVTASTTEPYKKEIKAEFNIKITKENISYSIEDEPNRIYATLQLVNANTEKSTITLKYDPKKVLIDTSDESYTGRTNATSTDVSGVTYINSITFDLAPEQSKNIKFYKVDPSADYTYPFGEIDKMIIEVTK